MKPDTLSLIAIMELIRLQGTGGVVDGMKTARALITVGKSVEDEYKGMIAKKSNVAINTGNKPSAEQGYFSPHGYGALHQRRVAAARFADEQEQWTTEWSQNLRVRVGSFLVDALMHVAHVDVTKVNKRTGAEETLRQPAFFHAYEYQKGHKLGVIKLNPTVSERLAKDGVRETLHPRHLPMLVKPKPWLSHNNGGYLHNRCEHISVSQTEARG
jgi:DNA-directed RNA polymerase, mitochondrial